MSDFKINIRNTATRAFAQNEGDQVNDQEPFIEDIAFVLQIALVKQKNDILAFLLDNYHQYWPKNLFDDWFKERLFKNDYFSQEHILEVIRIFFRSKTCKSIFGGLTARKQKEWIYEFVNEIESSFIRKDLPRETAIKSITL